MSRPTFRLRSLALTFIAPAILCAGPLDADTLIKKNGTSVEVKKAREEGSAYHLWFEAGELVVPKDQVASVEIEGDMSEYQPKDDKERAFLAQGYVRYKGQWMSKAGYELDLKKLADARHKRTAELSARSVFAKGWEVESKHFRFKSNTSPEILQHYVDLIEAYYDLMDSRIGIKPSPILARTKMRVNIFKRQKEMIEDAAEKDIDESILGYFSSEKQSLNFFHDYKDPTRTEVTALHECTHLLTYLIDPDYWPQIWMNEAMADYFGSCTASTTKGKVTLVPGRLEEDSILTMQQAIKDKTNIPLAKLFATEHDDYDGFHYAHGWAFVYFLENSPKYQKSFNKFFKDLYGLDLKDAQAEILNAGSDDKSGLRRRYPAKAIVDSMLKRLAVKDIDVLQKEWLEYIAAVPIQGPHARFLRGYGYAFRPGQSKKAIEDLDAAIGGGYQNPEAYWARGYAHLLGGSAEDAFADFKKATEMAPLEGLYHADLAWCLSGWWGSESGKVEGTDESKAEAQKHFGLAAALEPDNEELGQLYAQFLEARK